MISLGIVFLASCLASFIGSLQLGPVNLFVINSVLYQNKRAAFFVAIGGSFPEFLYCALAVYANAFLQQSSLFQIGFRCAFILVLIGIAYVFWKKQPGVIAGYKEIEHSKKDFKNALKGFSLAGLNPQLLPFWMFAHIFFNSIYFLKTTSKWHTISFILGSGFGAFVFLILLLMIVNKYKLQLLSYINNQYYFKALSILFFAISIQQLVVLVHNY